MGTSPPHEFERLAVVVLVFHLQELAGRAVPEVAVDLAGELVVLRLDRLSLGLDGLGAHEVAAHAVDLVAGGGEQLAGDQELLAPQAVYRARAGPIGRATCWGRVFQYG